MDKRYSSEEILNDLEFRRWMKGEIPDSGSFWRSYASRSQGHFREVQDAIDQYNALFVNDVDIDTGRMERQKQDLIRNIRFRDRLRKVRNATIVAGCAAILLVGIRFWGGVGGGSQRSGSFPDHEDMATGRLWIDNEKGDEVKRVELPDHSFAFLDPGSSIVFDTLDFADQREVMLKGSAFFIVEKMEGAQFVVRSDHFRTTVLGTEFYVSDDEADPESFVKVTEGKVSVINTEDKATHDRTETLTQMQSFHLKKDDLTTYRKSGDLNILTRNNQKKYSGIYRDVPLDTIFRDLSEKFKIDIRYDRQQLRDCTLTASFEGKKLDEVLYIICRLMNASYLEDQGQILIYSKGC